MPGDNYKGIYLDKKNVIKTKSINTLTDKKILKIKGFLKLFNVLKFLYLLPISKTDFILIFSGLIFFIIFFYQLYKRWKK